MGDMERIVIDSGICNGQPTIAGTRIAVRTVLEFLSAGDSVDEVLAAYPSLQREDVLACLDEDRWEKTIDSAAPRPKLAAFMEHSRQEHARNHPHRG